MWANFATDCPCGAEITISNGRIDWHDCQQDKPATLAGIKF
jgi:hypothetical protein